MKTKVITALTILTAFGAILLGMLLQPEDILSNLFLFFFGVIILLQGLPAIILFFATLRGASQSPADAEISIDAKNGNQP